MIDEGARNIVLCCDGTANEFAADRTNVVKLYYSLVFGRDRQITYYHPGLGTMEPPGALTAVTRRVTRLLGKAIGYGLEADIRDAYVFLMNNFRPGDRVFLFGFSRGAYTVRAVASLLKMFGLLPPDNDAFVPYANRAEDHPRSAGTLPLSIDERRRSRDHLAPEHRYRRQNGLSRCRRPRAQRHSTARACRSSRHPAVERVGERRGPGSGHARPFRSRPARDFHASAI